MVLLLGAGSLGQGWVSRVSADLDEVARWIAEFRGSRKPVSIAYHGNVVDLSLRGCRVESQTPVKPGTALEVRIETLNEEPPLKIQEAVVRWSQDQHFGLEFVVLAPEEWARLQHTVTQLELHPYQKDKSDSSSQAA